MNALINFFHEQDIIYKEIKFRTQHPNIELKHKTCEDDDSNSSLDANEIEDCFNIEEDYHYWNLPGYHPNKPFSKEQIDNFPSVQKNNN